MSASRRSLADEIRAMIAEEGPLSLERFMGLALGHPTLGYYMTRDPFGAAGDFVTAPEISQMFGEMLGLWSAAVWNLMGRPAPLRFVELGPGRGTLMADALRAVRIVPPFRAALDIHLVETSPVLRALQERTLEPSGLPATWHAALDTVPPGPAIVLANEFFDALPVRHYLRAPQGWRERLVGIHDGALAFGLAPDPEPSLRLEARLGAVLEVGLAARRVATTLAARLVRDGGAALITDYGYVGSRLGETLQAMASHRSVDPLADPGQADLTAHVDFAALAGAARAAGARVEGPAPQGDFLRALGIEARAETLKRRADSVQAAATDSALARLVDAGASGRPGMGRLFKVLGLASPATPPLPGFEAAGG